METHQDDNSKDTSKTLDSLFITLSDQQEESIQGGGTLLDILNQTLSSLSSSVCGPIPKWPYL